MMGPELILMASIVALEPSTQAPISQEMLRRSPVQPMMEEHYRRHLSKEQREHLERMGLYMLLFLEKRVVFKVEF